MGHDGEITTTQGGEGEDATHRGEFLARETTHDAGLAEERFDSRVAAGDGSRMGTGRTRTALAATSLDGGDAAALADERACMIEQFVRVGDIFDIEQFDVRVAFGIEVLVHVLQGILDTDLLAVAYAPNRTERKTFADRRLKDEDSRGTAA